MIRDLLLVLLVRLSVLPAEWLSLPLAGGLGWLWLFFLIGSCCCEEPHCGNCLSFPTRYTCTVSGVTNLDCTNCDLWNDTFVLTWDQVSRMWISEILPGQVCAGDPDNRHVRLLCEPPGEWYALLFTYRGSGFIQYRRLVTQWSCLGSNEMLVSNTITSCTDWPISITVRPI